jgi:hypothetical protein
MTCLPADASAHLHQTWGAPTASVGAFFRWRAAAGRGSNVTVASQCRALGGRMVNQSHAEHFSCRNCNAKYLLIRVESEPDPSHGGIECHHCGAPLNGREGQFILKYFLIDRPRRKLKPTRVK